MALSPLLPYKKTNKIIQLIGMWFIFLGVAIVNGGFREKYMDKHIGELAAHHLSTAMLSVSIFIITAIFIKHKQINDIKTLMSIGFFWAGLTLFFEFIFFHYVGGQSWWVLIADYNIFKGRIFSLVIVTTIFSPILARKLFINK